MNNDFSVIIDLNVNYCMWIYGKEAFLISDLLEDIKCLRQENGIEESIITITRTLKRKMIDVFPEEILLYPNGKLYNRVM